MFSAIKRAIIGESKKGDKKSHANSPAWNMESRPFTSALLGRHIQDARSAHQDLEEMLGDMTALSFSDDLAEETGNAIISTASAIAMNAMSDQGLSLVHLPGDPWPKTYVAGCVFAYLLGMSMWGHAKGEGVEADLRTIIAGILGNLTLAHPENDIDNLHSQALPAYMGLLEATEPAVNDWKESLNKLGNFYIFQWNTDNPEFAKMDMRHLFSELFGSLLKCLN